MNDTNPFAMALDVIKHDQSDENYFDRLIDFTTEFARLYFECPIKADLFALEYVRKRTACITAKFEQDIVFGTS